MTIVLIILAALAALVLLGAYLCYYLTFRVPKHPQPETEEYPIPPGKIYEPHRDLMIQWMKEVRAMPHETFCIRSFDGLQLYGNYYERFPGAPIELMVHGYRGNAERDLCGGVQRAFALGRNALLIDQRCCGSSQGHTITFGVKENRDCRAWIDFMLQHFGPDVQIVLTGISMGASTVLITAGEPLPDNVKIVLADCGFTSAKAIIHKVIRQLHLPVWPVYPLIRLGARLYGHFDPEAVSAIERVRQTKIPTIFIHGETDDFVPCAMSKENYDACAAPKTFMSVPEAGHGLSYVIDGNGYLKALADFSTQNGLPTTIQK